MELSTHQDLSLRSWRGSTDRRQYMIAKQKISVLVPVVLALIVWVMATASPALAQVEPPEASVGDGLLDDDHIVVETFTLAGDRISMTAYARDGVPIPVPEDFVSQGIVAADTVVDTLAYASGNGGTSSASGCVRVTVNNEYETATGSTAYWFHTWTNWCWTRSTKTISSVSTGSYVSGVNWPYVYQGVISDTTEFYSWYAGHPNSGFIHDKQARFDNCIVSLGCYASSYPRNELYSHSDGTWSWSTSD